MRLFSIFFNDTEYKLNGEEGYFFSNPQGIGMNLSPTMVDLRNGFFKPTAKDIIPQISIIGDVTLMGTTVVGDYLPPYEQYQFFLDLLLTAEKIEIGYTPYDATQYRIRVELDYITKAEMRGGWLTCTIAFRALTPWYTTTSVVVPISASVGDVNLYTCEYLTFGNAGAAFEINGNGGTPSTIIVGNVDGSVVYGSFGIATAQLINTNGNFIFSTRYDDSRATHTVGATTVDLVNRAIMSGYDIFPKLPPLKKSKINIFYSAGTTKPTTINATFYNYYRSV